MTTPTEWFDITRRNARSVQTTIGWIFWDPQAIAALRRASVSRVRSATSRRGPRRSRRPVPTRSSPRSVRSVRRRSVLAFDLVARHTTFDAVWAARDEAVVAGLHRYAPDIVAPLVELGPVLWPVVEQLPTVGRVFFAAHLRMATAGRSVAVGLARGELRARVARRHALGADRGERSERCRGVDRCTTRGSGTSATGLPRSRGTAPDALEAGWRSLAAKGLASRRRSHRRRSRTSRADRGRNGPVELAAVGAPRRRPRPSIRHRLRAAVHATPRARRRDRRPELPARVAAALTPECRWPGPRSDGPPFASAARLARVVDRGARNPSRRGVCAQGTRKCE